jgi:hypothetical protein
VSSSLESANFCTTPPVSSLATDIIEEVPADGVALTSRPVCDETLKF